MSVAQWQRVVQRYSKKLQTLQNQKATAAKKLADEEKKAAKAGEAVCRSSSAANIRSRLRTAQRHEQRAIDQRKKLGDLERKIGQEQERLHRAQSQLLKAQREQAKQEERERDRQARKHEGRLEALGRVVDQHSQLHDVAFRALEELRRLPDEITILFVAANPIDQPQLRLDEEVRAIREMIRKSEHRDALRLESRWAARPGDLLQAINECNPRVIHFSGHGSDVDGIVFQDDMGRAKPVTNEAIVQTVAAAASDVQLVYFNACYSLGQATAVVEHIPMAIGMTDAIPDDSARVFAAQFYSAIGFGKSIGEAFEQGKAAVMLEGMDQMAELVLAEGLDPRAMVLVSPE